ncbi:uncharacterized protein LOC141666015 [Apium graveolens]|uniref:uncharacterized protein LOC141666015 n=1 Tax=Apium graveolens TaxID=4045 RepID=UPI003D79EE9F
MSDIMKSPPLFAAAGDSSSTLFGKGSFPKVIPESDPLLGTGDFITDEGGSKGTDAKRAKRAKKGSESIGETLGWLPVGWTIISKIRANGATAGTVDKYYVEPITNKRFRSKIAVKKYLEIGSMKKTNSASKVMSAKRGTKKKVMGLDLNLPLA